MCIVVMKLQTQYLHNQKNEKKMTFQAARPKQIASLPTDSVFSNVKRHLTE